MSRLFYLENTASTNDYIQNQIDTSEIIPGSAVYTFHQTNGKGQQGYHWISDLERTCFTVWCSVQSTFLLEISSYFQK